MKVNKTSVLYIALSALFSGCFISAGTHGSISAYKYEVKKDVLQKAVMQAIIGTPYIYRDTTLDYLGNADININDTTAAENYYNDIVNYVTIKIGLSDTLNEYTFRYYGDSEYWKTSKTSEICICYAYDRYRNGGSEGNGKITEKMAQEFTIFFEKHFISKVDSILNAKHTSPKGTDQD